jgi:mono/diheme cytochrome c family protein
MFGCNAPPVDDSESSAVLTASAPSHDDRVARGRYLVSAAGCGDCHTPLAMGPNGPAPDVSRLLAGHPEDLVLPPAPTLPPGPWITTVSASMTAWSGPWGTSYTANLTPDDETGLGLWTEDNFVATIQNGRHMGVGRPLLPPMPASIISNYTDEDLRAIFAYLQSIPPVHNRVPHPLAPPAATTATSDEPLAPHQAG